MTRVGRYMQAEAVGTAPHETWLIRARDGAELGYIEWYPRWGQYVLQPEDTAVFSADCLRDLALFIAKCKNGLVR